MGQQLSHRRLALTSSTLRKKKWISFDNYGEESGEAGGIRLHLFGLHDYGYDNTSTAYVAWAVWLLETWASLSINMLEGAAILGITIFLQEHPEWWPENRRETIGCSYIYNVQAGYVWYHYFVKSRRDWATFAATWAAVLTDVGSLLPEAGIELFGEQMESSHFHHYIGATEGMTAAFFLDWLRPKGGKSRGWLLFLTPFILIGFMTLAGLKQDARAAGDASTETRLHQMEKKAR